MRNVVLEAVFGDSPRPAPLNPVRMAMQHSPG
jgi:hypothetical protein